MKDGIYTHLTFEEYCKEAGVNNSFLKVFGRSPAHGQAYLKAQEAEETDALKIGTLVHRFVLESERALDHLVCRPIVNGVEMDFRSKEGKAWRDEQLAAGRSIITRQERDDIFGMVASILRNPDARRLIDKAFNTEVSMFADWQGKVQRKCRLDLLTPGNVIPDIKTTEDARKFQFSRAIGNFKYFQQAAYYIDICRSLGVEKEAVVFIAVEKSAPYAVKCWQLDNLDVVAGREHYTRLLNQFVECLHSDEWPAYTPGIEIISAPIYATSLRDAFETEVA